MSTALPILVVDDDRYLLLALRQTLELAGFVVQTFERSKQNYIKHGRFVHNQ